MGNIYTGQFFYDDDAVDEKRFVQQAQAYGFNKAAYLNAFHRIPRYSRETIKHLMRFLVKFTSYISTISYSNVKLEMEIHERKLAEAALQESDDRLRSLINRVWKTGIPEDFPAKIYEDERLNKWYENFVYRLPTGEIVAVFDDATERKRAETELRESEEKFRNFTEQSFVGFYIIQDDIFKYVNPKFAEIFVYSVQECLNGMHFRKLVHTEDVDTVQKHIRKRVAGDIDTAQYTFRGVKKTGDVIHVSVYGSSLIYEGKLAAIGTILDVTKELELEKRMAHAQRMEAIGSLAGGIAHDFNNILFPIIGLSEFKVYYH